MRSHFNETWWRLFPGGSLTHFWRFQRKRRNDPLSAKWPCPLGPFKGINNDNKGFHPICSLNIRDIKHRFGVFSRGPGGFSGLREACWNRFHLSWYLSDFMVPSSDYDPVFCYRVCFADPLLATGRQPGTFSANSSGKSYTNLDLQGRIAGAGERGLPLYPPL